MFVTAGEARWLGVRYRVIAAGLGVAALILIVLLVANIFQDHDHLAPALSPEALQHLQGEGIRLTMLSLLLAVTAGAALLAWRAHSETARRLAVAQDTTQAILESLVGGVLALNLDGKVRVINRAACEMLELPPQPDLEAIGARHPELAAVIGRAVFEHCCVQDHDSRFTNSRGLTVNLRTTTSAQRNSQGAPAGVIVLVKDVTRIVAMDRELRRRDRLAAAGTLAAGIAHEIRNPLSALDLNIRLLRDEVLTPNPRPADLENYFDVLTAEARRLNRITQNFLQLTRPGPLSMAPVRAAEPLAQVIRLLEIEARERGVAFNLALAPENPLVHADEIKLEQLFLNILINAMQAMPQGGELQVKTRIVCDDDGRSVEVAFADTGVGIPPENLARLFDPYFTTRDGGTGLGLAIADRIATDHGGKILVESTPGRGTTMTVRLPLVAEDVECAHPLPSDAAQPGLRRMPD